MQIENCIISFQFFSHVVDAEMLEINFDFLKCYECLLLRSLSLWLFYSTRPLTWCYLGAAWSFWSFACYAFSPWIGWIFQCCWSKIYTNHNGSHTFSGFSCKSFWSNHSQLYFTNCSLRYYLSFLNSMQVEWNKNVLISNYFAVQSFIKLVKLWWKASCMMTCLA